MRLAGTADGTGRGKEGRARSCAAGPERRTPRAALDPDSALAPGEMCRQVWLAKLAAAEEVLDQATEYLGRGQAARVGSLFQLIGLRARHQYAQFGDLVIVGEETVVIARQHDRYSVRRRGQTATW